MRPKSPFFGVMLCVPGHGRAVRGLARRCKYTASVVWVRKFVAMLGLVLSGEARIGPAMPCEAVRSAANTLPIGNCGQKFGRLWRVIAGPSAVGSSRVWTGDARPCAASQTHRSLEAESGSSAMHAPVVLGAIVLCLARHVRHIAASQVAAKVWHGIAGKCAAGRCPALFGAAGQSHAELITPHSFLTNGKHNCR